MDWKNSNQKQRWLAASLLDIEPRLNRICGYKYLPELRIAIMKEIGKSERSKRIMESDVRIIEAIPIYIGAVNAMKCRDLALCACLR